MHPNWDSVRMEEVSLMTKSGPERRKEFPTATRENQASLIPKGLVVVQAS